MTTTATRSDARVQLFFKWPFPACFCNFFFSFQSTLEQLTIFQIMMIGKKREGGYSPFYDTLFRESPKPSKNRLLHFPKRSSPSRDSNSACSERMQSLYRLCHHHCLKQSQPRLLNIRLVIIRPPIWKSKLTVLCEKVIFSWFWPKWLDIMTSLSW